MHDILQAEDLISGISFDHLLADKGYDADRFRARIADAGAAAVIPSTRARSQAIPYDKNLYQDAIWSSAFSTRSSTFVASPHATRRP